MHDIEQTSLINNRRKSNRAIYIIRDFLLRINVLTARFLALCAVTRDWLDSCKMSTISAVTSSLHESARVRQVERPSPPRNEGIQNRVVCLTSSLGPMKALTTNRIDDGFLRLLNAQSELVELRSNLNKGRRQATPC